ncbi:TPA: glycosyltransferase family 4 protein [Citrobacter braakii]|nr:glycosyltransferase family 4 protein [Escherichia coli]MCH6435054.1 glycosyltransferase family 4 protein [Escherichia coli]HAW6060338.1 glycosyltransferase family 4 protein [Escherichia coli]HCB1918764.1 glycosyltransferase family 4 protein [Citrobacter braakii]HCO7940300.1 glycosyltransferase family 4 protein [Escherichia coli]
MKKIAHIQLLPLLSGAQRVSLDELQRLPNDKFDKYLICCQTGPLTIEAEKLGIKCIIIDSLTREISPIKDLKSLIHLIKIIKNYRFDIIHTHSSKTGVIGRLAGFISKTPLIIHTVHGYSFPAAKNKIQYIIYYIMERIGSMCGNKLICLHETDKEIAIQNLKVKPNDIYIIPNGVDVKKYTPPSIENKQLYRQSLNLSKDDIVIGMTGRLWLQKNPIFLLENMLPLLIENKNIKILFVGDGELKKELEKFINIYDLNKQVYLLGWRNDIYRILQSIDIFTLPSKWEGMPLAILEAQSSGLPCIVSNITGNNNLVSDNIDGFIFNLEPNGEEFRDKIKKLIYNKELRMKLGIKSREKVILHHSIEQRIQKIEIIYEELT